ncbi:RpiB/LacA/LacB family sugar-phosphate isomerase [Lactobacillus paragasseri]|uniref:RpiB/LacA/LacB family sugar-phosphate isomerase n=1 Tax=Lactobacillus paragasseri TaxID=2107999 RepID=A0ABD4ZYN8_9LACO|nr:RpiB/LacA/LacB family sugar-phosphate isomerase [Lactobacillus paragasseri]MDK7951988.1 RpiB/LacA/LacB family sugar-phosphate isomerase [Lactobacillus paragasseri]MDO6360643.1 RpiB/LacA/LacB family sugar-phosphate isomerase [Lactobacillus paragasseri]MDX5059340.1 RpiB/LacA/LacB family sugar-phosphate isomerase [Lactobacillus paragasseri]
MKIGLIQASSQKQKNRILEHYLNAAINSDDQLINFGIYPNSNTNLSYVQVSLAIALLINSKSLDFIVTGCTSGQGMMLACNTFPNIQCGYLPTPQDAFLFSHINNGNVVSFPLGLNWGWSGEINFSETMKALFKQPWGTGYPPSQASRKVKNTTEVKEFNQLNKKSMISILPSVDPDLLVPVLKYEPVYNFIIQNGKDTELVNLIKKLKHSYFN